MRIAGQRIKRTRLVHTDRYIVAVDVELVVPDDDPSEPCYESETVQLLKDIEEQARQGNVAWLAKHGKVYEALTAT